jgi:hypothetical protein
MKMRVLFKARDIGAGPACRAGHCYRLRGVRGEVLDWMPLAKAKTVAAGYGVELEQR